MPVVEVTEMWSNRENGYDGNGETFTAGFLVLLDGADTPEKAPRVARLAQGIPRRGDPHISNRWMVADRIVARPTSQITFEVTVTYTPIGGAAGDPGQNPLLIDPTVRWGTRTITEEVDEDKDGNPLVNVVNEPFDPPIARQYADISLQVQKNIRNFNVQVWHPFLYSVNSDEFYGLPAGTLLLVTAQARPVSDGPFLYYDVTAEWCYRKDGWKRRVLNQGFRKFLLCEEDPDTGETIPVYENIVDSMGREVTTPVPLDANGQPLPCGAGGGSGLADGHWLEFELYESKDHSQLDME